MYAAVRELFDYRELLATLAWRDVRVRYKQAALGIAWAVLLPVSLMLVFTFVFTRAVEASFTLRIGVPYALYAYVGLVPWTFFSVALGNCLNSLVANRNLVTKVYFPREVFPLSCVAASLVDFVIALGVLAILVGYFHGSGRWTFQPSWALLFLPVVAVVQILLTAGLGMILAMANLFYRDVRQIFGVGMQLLMFVSAVVVPPPDDGSMLARVIALNPLVPLIDAYRDCLLFGRTPDLPSLVYVAMVASVIAFTGWRCFRKASFRFAECI